MPDSEELQRALFTMEPHSADTADKTALVTVTTIGGVRRAVSNAGEVVLLLRSFDASYAIEIQARQAFNARKAFRVAVHTSRERLKRLGFED